MSAHSSLVSNLRDQMARDEERQRLLACMKRERQGLQQAIESFDKQERRNDSNCITTLQTILASLDKMLVAGDWEGSLFLRNTIKPLKELREKTASILAQYQGSANQAVIQTPNVEADHTVVYISMFQTDGHNLRLWELQLRGLARYVLGRPVYEQEGDVAQMIRAKLAKASEAYVAVAVPKLAILTDAEMRRQDREGRHLMTLKEGSVSSDQILEFIHLGLRYHFVDGRLIKQI